jgi:hypothetical protein
LSSSRPSLLFWERIGRGRVPPVAL